MAKTLAVILPVPLSRSEAEVLHWEKLTAYIQYLRINQQFNVIPVRFMPKAYILNLENGLIFSLKPYKRNNILYSYIL